MGIGCQRGRGLELELEWEDSSEKVLLHAIRGRQTSQREMSDAGNPLASVSSEDRESNPLQEDRDRSPIRKSLDTRDPLAGLTSLVCRMYVRKGKKCKS